MREQFDKFRNEFERQFAVEQSNITVPGERELVDELSAAYRTYLAHTDDYFKRPLSGPGNRGDEYFSRLLPEFENLRPGRGPDPALEPAKHGADERASLAECGQLDPAHDCCAPRSR